MTYLKIGLLAGLCFNVLNAASGSVGGGSAAGHAEAAEARPVAYAHDYGVPLNESVGLLPEFIRIKDKINGYRSELFPGKILHANELGEIADHRDTSMSILNSIIVHADASKRDQLLPAAQAASDRARSLASRIYAEFGPEIEELKREQTNLVRLVYVGIDALEKEKTRQDRLAEGAASGAGAEGGRGY